MNNQFIPPVNKNFIYRYKRYNFVKDHLNSESTVYEDFNIINNQIQNIYEHNPEEEGRHEIIIQTKNMKIGNRPRYNMINIESSDIFDLTCLINIKHKLLLGPLITKELIYDEFKEFLDQSMEYLKHIKLKELNLPLTKEHYLIVQQYIYDEDILMFPIELWNDTFYKILIQPNEENIDILEFSIIDIKDD